MHALADHALQDLLALFQHWPSLYFNVEKMDFLISFCDVAFFVDPQESVLDPAICSRLMYAHVNG